MNMTSNTSSAVEKQLKRFSIIVEKHVQHIKQTEENFDAYTVPSWTPSTDFVQVKLATFDQIDTYDLIQTDNLSVNKTVTVLLSVCLEMTSLCADAEENFFIPLSLYERSEENCKPSDVTSQEKFSKVLPILDQIFSIIQHVERVTWNVIQQLNALYSVDRSASDIHAGNAHFQVVFELLGKMLSSLIVFDELFANSAKLRNHLTLYINLTHSASADRTSADNKDLNSLEHLLTGLEKKLWAKSILKVVLHNVLQRCRASVSKNQNLQDEMLTVIIGWSSQVKEASFETVSTDTEKNVLALTALALCHQVIFDTHDRKTAKELLSLYKKVPCNTVCIGHVWFGEKYIKSRFPSYFSLFDRKGVDSITPHRKNFLSCKTQSINNDIQTANFKVLGWSAQMELATKRPSSQLTKQDLSHRASVLLHGLELANNLRYMAESILGLHTASGQPMGKTCVVAFGHLLEILKAIEHTYHKCTSMLIDTLPHLRQYLSYQILSLIKNAKTRVSNERKLDTHNLDVLAALTIAEQALAGNATSSRRLLARISLSVATQNKILHDEELSMLLLLLKRLELANDIQTGVKKATSTEFLYLHQVIFKFYIQDYLENFPSCCHRIHYMLAAHADAEILLRRPNDLPDRELLLKNLKADTEDILKNQFLEKLSKAVEIELRLNTHKHLHLDNRSPFEKPLTLLLPLTQLQPLDIFGSFYNVKEYVEQYLEKTFYSLTVLASHNCSTYEQMRNYASSNLGLITVPSHLPSHTLEQGVDVLEIMRNINVFVQKYQYNLNQQFFIEIESNNKHLNTVSIKHIANSIRTHGTGIINTTVNYTYQFLKKKFHILSQFLYDEHIKSRLLKDLQYWKEVKTTEKSFPYERAEKFHKGIRRLGMTNDGLSYLDQCRKLVTHIGNAMGYIRLVRSGGLHCISAATQFIPDLQKVVQFSDLCNEDKISVETLKAAQNLDAVTDNLTSHFHEETDYFKIMVDVFSVLRETKNSHLRNFCFLAPALTVNFIEYFLTSKGKLQKKTKIPSSASFTDDGFAMGLAYVLTVLDKNSAFDSLHWWSGVRRKFITDMEKIQQECERTKGGDDKLRQTLLLTLSRLKQQQREFELLFLGVSSARVFFKGSEEGTTSVKKEDKTATEEEGQSQMANQSSPS